VVGEWANISGRGSFTDFSYIARPGDGGMTFRWNLEARPNGPYTLSAWVPDDPSPRHASRQTYRIHHADGETDVEIDQKSQRGAWIALGRFRCDDRTHVILDNRGDGYIVADSLLLTPCL
jgi:hypothetical protein